MAELEKVNIGQSRGDNASDRVYQLTGKFNRNMDRILSDEDTLAGTPDQFTGLSFDSTARTLSVSIPSSRLLQGTDDGVSTISKSSIVQKGLIELGADETAVSRLTNDLDSFLIYRENLLDLKNLSDYELYQFVYVQEQVFSLPERILPLYYWDGESTEQPDDLYIIKPDGISTGASGRWVLSQYQRISQSGVSYRIGPNDSQNRIKSVFDNAQANSTILLSPGVYTLSETLSIPDNIAIVASSESHIDLNPDQSNQVILRAGQEEMTLLTLSEGVSLIGLTFEGKTNTFPLVDVEQTGVSLSDGTFAFTVNSPVPNYFYRCRFRPVDQGQTVAGIRLRTTDATNAVGPLDRQVTTAYFDHCIFETQGGDAVDVRDFHHVSISNSHFYYPCLAVIAQRQGLATVDKCRITGGQKGFEASDPATKRHIAELKADATNGDTQITLEFSQDDGIKLTHQFYPRLPIYLKLTSTNTDFETQIDSYVEQVYSGDTPQYKAVLKDPLNQDLSSETQFDVEQAAYIEVADSIIRDVGVGSQPDARESLPDASKIALTSQQGLISQYNSTTV